MIDWNKYNSYCHWLEDYHDMGATIMFCKFKPHNMNPLNHCPKQCKNHIESEEVDEIIRNYIKEKNEV